MSKSPLKPILFPITVTSRAFEFLSSRRALSYALEATPVILMEDSLKHRMEKVRRNLLDKFEQAAEVEPDIASDKCTALQPTSSIEQLSVPDLDSQQDENDSKGCVVQLQEDDKGPLQTIDDIKAVIPNVMKPRYDCAVTETVLGKEGGRNTRRQFCIFCKKLLAKLPNHIEAVHKNEEVVKRLKSYPKGHPVRQEVLKSLRTKGAAEYNSNRAYNKGVIVPARRPNTQQDARNFLPCPHCTIMLQTSKLSRHMKSCDANYTKAQTVDKYFRALARKSQAKTHFEASEVLRERVLPILRLDQFTEAIMFDRLAIHYGNKQCSKYASSTHHDPMIRCNLRHLGRLLIEARQLNSAVTNLQSLMTPAMHPTVAQAIENIAQFSPTTGMYRAPSAATLLCNLIKKVALEHQAMCIQDNDKAALDNVKDFISLFVTVTVPVASKTVEENRIKLQRRKKVVLPIISDVNKLAKYLERLCKDTTSKLQKSFTFEIWKLLGVYTMGSVIILNRRRPGEMQRMELEDYNSVVQVDKNTPDYEFLSVRDQELANTVALYLIRGKLNRTVSVVLFDWMREAIDLFLLHRNRAGVLDSNPYLFGLPGGGGLRPLYINIGPYIREFSIKCGAQNPSSLRTTVLRKHLATASASLHGGDLTQVQNLASHLGHADKIHKDIYTQKTVDKSLIQVVKLLASAQGEAEVASSPPVASVSYVVNDDQLELQPSTSQSTCVTRKKRLRSSSTSSTSGPDEGVPTTRCLRSKKLQPVVVLKRLPIFKAVVVEEGQTKSGRTFGKRKNQKSKKCSPQGPPKSGVQNNSASRLTKAQEAAASEYFREYTQNKSCPSLDIIQGALTVPELSDISLPFLRRWIAVQIADSPIHRTPKKRKFQTRHVKERARWTPTSVSTLHQAFARYLDSSSLPSFTDIREVRSKYPCLQNRSSPTIKSALSNIRRKRTQ